MEAHIAVVIWWLASFLSVKRKSARWRMTPILRDECDLGSLGAAAFGDGDGLGFEL
jgi:hypothetical protein